MKEHTGLDLELDLKPINLGNLDGLDDSYKAKQSHDFETNDSDLFGIDMLANKKKQRTNSLDSGGLGGDSSGFGDSNGSHSGGGDGGGDSGGGFFSGLFGNSDRPSETTAEAVLNTGGGSGLGGGGDLGSGDNAFDFDNALNDIDLKNLDDKPKMGEDMVGPSFPNLGNSNTSFSTHGDSHHTEIHHGDNYEYHPAPKRMTYEEIQKEKFIYLNKLEQLKSKNVVLPKNYSMASDLEEMKSDYAILDNRRRLKNSIKFQRKLLVTAVSGVEKANTYFNPLDVHLDGWSQDVNDNINEFDDIFEELYEKYKEIINTSPELKLLGAIATSGFMFHMNKSLTSHVFEKIVQQDPNLMQQFTNQAMNAMKTQVDGGGGVGGAFGNMMSGMMGRQQPQHDEPPIYNPLNGPPFSNPQGPPPRGGDVGLDDMDALLANLPKS